MKMLLRLEELAMFLLSMLVLYGLTTIKYEFHQVQWLWFLLLLFGPDISILGYLAGNKIGAYCYNFFHHKGIAMFLILVGITFFIFSIEGNNRIPVYCILIGVILFGHSSMDRFFGFGLKTEEGFKFTHLGKIGKEKDENV